MPYEKAWINSSDTEVISSPLHLTQTELERRIRELDPWHQDFVVDGVSTNGWMKTGGFWYKMELKTEELMKKTLLDVGCSNGFYSIKAAQKGAWVTGIDIGSSYRSPYLKNAQFLKRYFGLNNLSFRSVDIYNLPIQKYDIILFSGVLYHGRYPTLMLRKIRAHMKEDTRLFLVSQIRDNTRFVPESERPKEDIWWFYDRDTLTQILSDIGFETVKTFSGDRSIYYIELAKGTPAARELAWKDVIVENLWGETRIFGSRVRQRFPHISGIMRKFKERRLT